MNTSEQSAQFTVFGSAGYIGSSLVNFLRAQDISVRAVSRNETIKESFSCGHLVYAAGITSDFRKRIFETVDAHVSTLAKVLSTAQFESFTYLSSARVYLRSLDTNEEADNPVNVLEREDLYNVSKLMGESLCLGVDKQVRILRISNVYSSGFASLNFLSSVVREACDKKELVLQSSLNSERDYVVLEDVLSSIKKIAESGRRQLYNVASGENTTTGEITDMLAAITGCSVKVADPARIDRFPPVNIGLLKNEFDFCPTLLKDKLPGLIREYADSKDKY